MSEKINPEYYKNKKIETYEAIVSQLSPPGGYRWFRWQMLKYIMRFGEKHGGTILQVKLIYLKLNWYSEKLLQYLTDLEKQGYKLKPLTMLPNYLRINNEEWKWKIINIFI
jgi:hypothetical protein